MTYKEKFIYVFKLPLERKYWFFFTIISSCITYLYLRLFKTNKLHFLMGHHHKNVMLCIPTTKKQELKAWRIARVVEAVCRGVPWKCSCLIEAICSNVLLKFYRIPSVLYLGAMSDKNTANKLKAHAWLTVGQYTVIGGQVANEGYIVTATFTRPKIVAPTLSKTTTS